MTPPEVAAAPLRQTLKFSLFDAVFYSLMVGWGETYLAAFALAAGLSQISAGLLTVIPVLAGAGVQLFSPLVVHRLQSRRRLAVSAATLQATSLLALAALAFTGWTPLLVVFLFTAGYWAAGMSVGPSWNAWIGNVVPRRIWVRFFSRRSRLTQIFTLLSLASGGIFLRLGSEVGHPLLFFGILFTFAGIARFVSSRALSRHGENPMTIPPAGLKPIRDFFKLTSRAPFRIVVFYLFIFQLGTYISAPYFAPYMLQQLDLTYDRYMFLIGIAFFSRVVTYTFVHRTIRGHDVRPLLVVGSLGIVPIPILWTFSTSYEYLMCVEFYSGFAWACHEMAVFFLLLNRFGDNDRAHLLTSLNLSNALGMVTGSLIGARLFQAGGAAMETYHLVFWISSVGRAVPLTLLPALLERRIDPVKMFLRVVSIIPNAGAIARPIFLIGRSKRNEDREVPPSG